MQTHPTPYPDVNAMLGDFLAGVQAILGERFVGMYLYGSLALGDFDPQGSDIDFIVVTDGELSDDLFVALHEMHARFSASGSPWAAKIEAAYVPQGVLRVDVPAAARYPQIEKGGTLALDRPESGWIFHLYTLREHGVVVAGPDPRTLIGPVDLDEMRRASAAYAVVWLEQARQDPGWLDWLRRRENQAFVVLTLCRMLYTLDYGTMVSKLAAARWMQRTQGARWDALIERALAGRHDSGVTPDRDVNDTVALVEDTVERYQHAAP